jgi:sugar phosphate isomerase/epimerase
MDISRLCIHTETVKPLGIEEVARKFKSQGIPGISVWRHTLESHDPRSAGNMLRDHGLEVISLVRGGFFPAADPGKRKQAIQENKKAIEEAAELGAPLLVLVCGAEPDQSLIRSREQIAGALQELIPFAAQFNIKLGIEPLHPMYSDTRSAINTMRQANDLAEQFDSGWLGVVIDLYHTWWDQDFKHEIERCGKMNKIFAYHVCDWKVPTNDMLLDRGMMGEGCIPVKEITGWVEEAGFEGPVEVEIFSEKYWSMDQDKYIEKIKEAFTNNV